MALTGITPRAWQIWIPGYEGRYLWNFATQRVMSCVYPGATTPTNLHTSASNPGYTLKRDIDVLHGGKGKYFRHVDLTNWLNPMNPRNKTPAASSPGTSTAQSDGTVATPAVDSGGTYIVAYTEFYTADDNLKPTCVAICNGEHAFEKAQNIAKRATIEKGEDMQIYKLVAEAKYPTVEDVKVTRITA